MLHFSFFIQHQLLSTRSTDARNGGL